MALKETLELIGDEIVIQKFAKVQDAGEKMQASLSKPIELKVPDLTPPDPKPVEEFAARTLKLKEALHTLAPILRAAGVQIGEFGAFARLASGSIIGLGVALAGAVVVGLAKLEENAARTKGVLTDLFGSSDKGEKAFGALDKQAKQFGTTVEGLAPGLESFQQALNNVDRTAKGFVALKAEDLPGASLAQNAEKVTTAYGNFIKILRAGRLTQEDAEKSAKAFFDTIKEGGVVTSAALKNLPVGTIQLLQQALGQGGLTAKQFFAAIDTGLVPIDKLQQALINFGPAADKAFDSKAIKTFGDELGKLFTTLGDGFQKLTGKGFSDFVIGELERIRKGIESTITDLQRLRQFDTSTGSDVMGKTIQGLRKLGDALVSGEALRAGLPSMGPEFNEAFGSLGTQAAEAFVKPLEKNITDATGKIVGKIIDNPFFKDGVNIPVTAEFKDDKGQVKAKIFENPFFKEGVTIPVEPEVKKDDFQKNLDAIPQSIDDVAGKTLPKWKSLVDDMLKEWDRLGNLPAPVIPVPRAPAPGGGIPPLAATPGLGLLQMLFGGGQAAQAAPAVDPATLVTPFQTAADQIKAIWTDLAAFISTTVTSIDLSAVTTALVTPFQTAVSQIQSVIQQVLQSVQELNQAIQQALQGAGQLGGFAAGGGLGFAGGGIVRGGGTTTSDSILAWLSNREFVVNAKAVSHYGPDFFAALNAMRLPQNFNMGGMARMMAGNKFAGGGMVKGNPVVLNIDRKSFNMTAGDDTITQLKRFAVASQLSSTGRKPRWVK